MKDTSITSINSALLC